MNLRKRAEAKLKELHNNQDNLPLTHNELSAKTKWLESLIEDDPVAGETSDLSKSDQDEKYRLFLDLYKLLDLINSRFNNEEFKTICFTLGIDQENFSAQGKKALARELILELERRKSLKRLMVVLVEHNNISLRELLDLLSEG